VIRSLTWWVTCVRWVSWRPLIHIDNNAKHKAWRVVYWFNFTSGQKWWRPRTRSISTTQTDVRPADRCVVNSQSSFCSVLQMTSRLAGWSGVVAISATLSSVLCINVMHERWSRCHLHARLSLSLRRRRLISPPIAITDLLSLKTDTTSATGFRGCTDDNSSFDDTGIILTARARFDVWLFLPSLTDVSWVHLRPLIRLTTKTPRCKPGSFIKRATQINCH